MTQVKSLAVRKLEGLDFGNVATKLQMAQGLGVQKWFSSGMKTLITRKEPLATLECQVLSEQHILQILDLRERAHYRNQYTNHYYGYYTYRVHIRNERGEIPEGVDLAEKLSSLL